jgi:hypothetical protein
MESNKEFRIKELEWELKNVVNDHIPPHFFFSKVQEYLNDFGYDEQIDAIRKSYVEFLIK